MPLRASLQGGRVRGLMANRGLIASVLLQASGLHEQRGEIAVGVQEVLEQAKEGIGGAARRASS